MQEEGEEADDKELDREEATITVDDEGGEDAGDKELEEREIGRFAIVDQGSTGAAPFSATSELQDAILHSHRVPQGFSPPAKTFVVALLPNLNPVPSADVTSSFLDWEGGLCRWRLPVHPPDSKH